MFYDKNKVPPYLADEIEFLFSSGKIMKNMARWISFSRKYDVPKTLDNMQAPVNFIWGEHDNITPIEPWLTLSKEFNIPMTVIKGSGHSPMLETLDLFAKELLLKISK